MAGLLPGDPTHHGMHEGGPYRFSQDKLEEAGRWYLSRKEIEENSPSKRDGIDLKKETYLRKSYCTFLQDLGMRLKVYILFVFGCCRLHSCVFSFLFPVASVDLLLYYC